MMPELKICVCGNFGSDTNQFNGQVVKTREVYHALVKKYGKDNVENINSYGWEKHPMKVLKTCISISNRVDSIVILPARRGVKVFIPLFVWLKKKYNFKLHYVVIGGWLYEILTFNKKLLKKIKRIDYIYIENYNLIEKLNSIGVRNIFYMVNFKDLNKTKRVLKEEKTNIVLKCCIFSRVEEEKGILDAVDVINKYNDDNDLKITLDIYGKVKDSFKDRFDAAIFDNEYIKYRGIVKSDASVGVIEKYDLLLFPTKYKTEGIPGTIVDAYFAGVPVLASKWENFSEIIEEGKTGFGYNFGDVNDFSEKLITLVKNKGALLKMRNECLKKADKYTPNVAAKILFKNIESGVE